MKNVLYFLLLLSHCAFAQEKTSLDTIFANEFHNVSLFFSSPIRQGITGSSNFTFSFNEDSPQYFGLLQATPGGESSLLVLTTDGKIYSYFLTYRAELPQLNYFVSETASIGNEVPKGQNLNVAEHTKDTVDMRQIREDSIAQVKFYENLSGYYLRTSTGNLKSKKKDQLKLIVKELIYYMNETYMVFELENKSGIDFELNYLNVYLTQGNRKRNASFQKVLKQPLYTYNFPEVIKDQQRRRFVYVLPKFTMGENERVEVEVRESKGNRYLKLTFREQ